MGGLVEAMKKASVEAANQRQGCNIILGRVRAVNPLQIETDQKLVLSKAFLVLTETAAGKTLKVNDRVILIKAEGGQQYFVLDRAGGKDEYDHEPKK